MTPDRSDDRQARLTDPYGEEGSQRPDTQADRATSTAPSTGERTSETSNRLAANSRQRLATASRGGARRQTTRQTN
jgi:hypothetical protein